MMKAILILHPVWFDYDVDREKLLVITPKITKKVRNLRSKSKCYFTIDDENITYKGVKGKGTAKVIEDQEKKLSHTERKYI